MFESDWISQQETVQCDVGSTFPFVTEPCPFAFVIAIIISSKLQLLASYLPSWYQRVWKKSNNSTVDIPVLCAALVEEEVLCP